MVDTVSNKVVTTFDVNAAGALRGLGQMHSLMSSLPGPLGMLGRGIGAVGAVLGPIGGLAGNVIQAFSGFAGGGMLSNMVRLNAQFEESQIGLAGMLSAVDRTSDFTTGLAEAGRLTNRIYADAAKLPGEAEDYIYTFRTGLSALQAAMPTADNMGLLEWSDRFTAFGIMFGYDTARISRDMRSMLNPVRGNVNTRTGMFAQLLPLMQRAEGQANLTSRAFNDMAEQERWQLMEGAMTRLQPMLEAASRTWDAVSGALTSATNRVFRMAGAPLFDQLKNTLLAISNSLVNADGELTPLANQLVAVGNVISDLIVAPFLRLQSIFAQMQGPVSRLFGNLAQAPQLRGMVNTLGAFGGHVGNSLQSGAGNQAMQGSLQATGDIAPALFSVLNNAAAMLSPLFDIFIFLWGEVNDIAQAILVPALDGIGRMFGYLVPVIESLSNVLSFMFDNTTFVGQSLGFLWSAIGNLFTGLYDVLGPVLYVLGVVGDYLLLGLTPIISAVALALGGLIDAIGNILRWIGVGLNMAVGRNQRQSTQGPGFFEGLMARFRARSSETTARDVADRAVNQQTRQQRSGNTTNQDFRYSRFDITQRFAEGFDPDRIAVMFANDLGRVGELRLQSGLEPAFGIR